jgi:putative FmdB family regulatory protein
MPLYEYRCRSCGHQFEIQQSISDDALTECPECQGSLRKVFTPVGISFKGSGFYKNDARSSSRSGSSTSASSGGSDSSSSDSGTGSASSGGGQSSGGGESSGASTPAASSASGGSSTD